MGYENGLIYTIRSHQTTDIYIGSTTQPLYKRIYQHKKNFNRWKIGKYCYVSSFELMKYDDVYIELLELFPCSSKNELCRREGQLQREMECLNKNVAGRTMDEYIEENKDKIKIRKKEWFEANKDKMKIQKKEYREKNKNKINEKFNCECGSKYTHKNKSKHFKTKKHQKYILNVEKTT